MDVLLFIYQNASELDNATKTQWFLDWLYTNCKKKNESLEVDNWILMFQKKASCIFNWRSSDKMRTILTPVVLLFFCSLLPRRDCLDCH